jgi:hypothetical protein
MNKKYCLIIDAYPQTPGDQEILLENLKILKVEEIDVLVTSHHPCSSEIIENCTYFLFEKKNNYYYLDSDVLNNDLSNLKEPVFMKYYGAGETTFKDKAVVTGWSVSITSQFFNAIIFLKSKGYEYAFYLISDFIYPESGFSRIIETVDFSKNFLIKNSEIFSSWLAPFFFGFKIDDKLLLKVPKEDLSQIKVYQKYFTNCSFEDVITNTFSNMENIVYDHSKLDEIFGKEKWNTNKSTIQNGAPSLHYLSSSSVYVNLEYDNKFCLFLYLSPEYKMKSQSVLFDIQITNEKNEIIYHLERDMMPGFWFKEYLNFESNVILNKKLVDDDVLVEDSIRIGINNLEKYSIIKKFI